MKGRSDSPNGSLTPALEAIGKLRDEGFARLQSSSTFEGLIAHDEIEQTSVGGKAVHFYRHFLPLRDGLVTLLADTYRRYFKLALAHPHQAGSDPDKWVWGQLQLAVRVALEWIRDWYILACDGTNQFVRPLGTVERKEEPTALLSIPATVSPFPPPKSWRAPAWLFQVSRTLVGIDRLKTKHIPATDSERKLGAGHTRLLLKGARRVFLWELEAAIKTLRNEEIAAAGAIPAGPMSGQRRGPNKRKGWKQREKLYCAIQQALARNPALQGQDLCAELDKRHAPPLYDWTKSGEWRERLTWREAWQNPILRDRIRRVRQEAQKAR
jgi:hypothetical protein